MFAELDAIAARRGVRLEGNRTHDVRPVPTPPWMQDAIAASIERRWEAATRRLPSAATTR